MNHFTNSRCFDFEEGGRSFTFIRVIDEQNANLKQPGQEIETAPPGFEMGNAD